MPFPSIEKACPVCLGNLSLVGSERHPQRRGYDVHTYSCIDCGPMVNVTQMSDDSWPSDWLNTRSEGESSIC